MKRCRQATVILQARMGSKRFPGKVLADISGQPMLFYGIATLQRSPAVKRIVIATTEKSEDDVLVQLAGRMGIDCCRGPEDNVLERFFLAARMFPDEVYFRATGDNPVLDWRNPGRTLSWLCQNDLDYCCEEGMPLGSIVEAFRVNALQRAHQQACTSDDLEHVTLIMKRGEGFAAAFFACPKRYRRPELRLSVDYPADLARVRLVLEKLYQQGIPDFGDVLRFCRQWHVC